MNRIIKGYNEFIRKNEEFQFQEEQPELNIGTEQEAGSPEAIEELPGEGNIGQKPEATQTDVVDNEEAGYIGDRAMSKLAETLGVELAGNTIDYEGAKIEYVAEFDGFLIKGGVLGVKKVPVSGGNIQEAVDRVIDLVGTAVLSEKKVIKEKSEAKEKAKPAKKAKVKESDKKEDNKKSKDDDEDNDDKKFKNLKSFKKKK